MDSSDRDGPSFLPDGSLAALRRMVRRVSGGLPDGLRILFRFETGRRLARQLARVASADLCFGEWFDSRRARRHARRLTRGASADGSTHARQGARWLACIILIRDGPGACPTARSCRFSGSALRRMVRFETGQAAGLAARFLATAHSMTASQVRSGKEYAHARTSQGGCGSKPGASRPGRSNDMPNVSPHRIILSCPVGERFYRPIREREDIGSMTSLLVSRI